MTSATKANTTNAMSDLICTRAKALVVIREILEEEGFLEVTTPEITSATGACENTDTLFSLDYFGKKGFLRQTAQLDLEYLVIRDNIPSVYTVGKSFRAEPRVTNRHLTEFTLIEIEAKDYDLYDLIDLQESIVRQVWESVHDEEFPEEPFPVISYEIAIDILGKEWGTDFNSEDERRIVEHYNNIPVHITNYPEEISFFNMFRDRVSPPDRRTVSKCDFILPCAGETFGGSIREYDYDILTEKLYSSPMYHQLMEAGGSDRAFKEYLELFNTPTPVQRAGFGIGFERLIQWVLQEEDVRHSQEFPMTRETI